MPNPKKDLFDQAELTGNDGTGGTIFRNLFTAFLNESREYLSGERSLERGAELYKQAAENWTGIAGLITKMV